MPHNVVGPMLTLSHFFLTATEMQVSKKGSSEKVRFFFLRPCKLKFKLMLNLLQIMVVIFLNTTAFSEVKS